MRHRIPSWVNRNTLWPALAALTLVGAVGCDGEQPVEATGIGLTLRGCVAEDAAAAGCRGRLIAAAGDAPIAGCLVLVPEGDSDRLQRLELGWRDGALTPTDPATTVNLAVGEELGATLFLLSGPIADCQGFGAGTECRSSGSCAVRYGPVVRPVTAGETVIDFAPEGDCVTDTEQQAFSESCDGVDNDCDGRVDEARPGRCTGGRGVCETVGDRSVCRNDEYVCDVTPPPRQQVIPCNAIDEDCDGDAQEGDDCTECAVDDECLGAEGGNQCVDGLCLECDPADGAGCDVRGERPVCGDGRCRACEGDAECGAGLVCAEGLCQGCDPGREGTCPDAAAPVCDAVDLTCRPCAEDAECGAMIQCVAGLCAACEPGSNIGCGPEAPVCDPETLTCRLCEVNSECARAGFAVCLDAQCVECDPDGNVGCEEPGRPICAIVEAGDPPTCGPCERDDECPTGECRTGRCVGCDPTDNSGCDPLGGQPICDDSQGADNAFCRACDVDPECPAGLGRGVCNGGVCAECGDLDARGCDEAGDAPICAQGACRGCDFDNECRLRPGPRDLCVGRRCRICDPADDRGCDDPAAPICDGGERCRPCGADAECRGGQCVGGRCVLCDPLNNDGCQPERPICAADGSACNPCEDDDECGGKVCVGGQCRGCDPNFDRGCLPTGTEPICDRGTLECRGCVQGRMECPANRYCLEEGRCAECDPDSNAGCAGNPDTPICGDAAICIGCQEDDECRRLGLGNVCEGGACLDCAVGTNRGCDVPTAPICEGGRCRGCLGDQECPAGRGLCRGDACVECTENEGCDPQGPEPFCGNDGACRPCLIDAECPNPARTYCVAGTCQACDPNAAPDASGCDVESALPLCVGGVCVSCQARPALCAAVNAEVPYCLPGGGCGTCDPVTHAGCVPESALPICDDGFNCRGCGANGECVGNSYGDLCNEGRGQCECNDDRHCDDPARPDCPGGGGFHQCRP